MNERCAGAKCDDKRDRTPEAVSSNNDAGVRYCDTPAMPKRPCRALGGTSPVSGVLPKCAPAPKMRRIASGVLPQDTFDDGQGRAVVIAEDIGHLGSNGWRKGAQWDGSIA